MTATHKVLNGATQEVSHKVEIQDVKIETQEVSKSIEALQKSLEELARLIILKMDKRPEVHNTVYPSDVQLNVMPSEVKPEITINPKVTAEVQMFDDADFKSIVLGLKHIRVQMSFYYDLMRQWGFALGIIAGSLMVIAMVLVYMAVKLN